MRPECADEGGAIDRGAWASLGRHLVVEQQRFCIEPETALHERDHIERGGALRTVEGVGGLRPQRPPLFQALAKATGEAPRWNFHKYLVDRKGQVVGSLASEVRRRMWGW